MNSMKDHKSQSELLSKEARCPCCDAPYKLFRIAKDDFHDEPIPAEKDYAGYAISQIAYRTIGRIVCDHCGKEFTHDFGVSRYSVFNSPLSCTNTNEIRLLAQFESEFEYNYSLYRAENPSDKGTFIYYIIYEGDKNPVFLTRTREMHLVNDHKETLKFLYSNKMTRYK